MVFKKGEHQWWQKEGISRTSYAHRAREIISNHLSRALTHKEEIHHLDGDWTNNNLDNLYMFASHKEHMIYHGKLIRWTRKELDLNKTKKQCMDEWHSRNKGKEEEKRILRREKLIKNGVVCQVCKRKDFLTKFALNLHLGRAHGIKIDPQKYQRDWYLRNRERILKKRHKGVKKNDA